MIDSVLKSLENVFGEKALAWIITSGYLMFLLIFFQKDKVDDDIWDRFQWGDRVLIGVIFGAFFYVAFVSPLILYIERFYKFLFMYDVETLESLSDTIYMFGCIFSLIPLLYLRKKADIKFYSEKGINYVLSFIYLMLPTYFYFSLSIFIIELISHVFINTYFVKYRMLLDYLWLETFFNIIQSTFIIFGMLIILWVLEYLKYSVITDITLILKNYPNKIGINSNWKKIFTIKAWVILWVIVTLISTATINVIDSNYAVITPKLILTNNRVDNNINLYREPSDKQNIFTNYIHQDIVIKYPFFTKLKKHTIKNPSNFSALYYNEDVKGPHTFDDDIFISPIIKNKLIKYLELSYTDGKVWDTREFTLHYEATTKPNVLTTEYLTNRTSLGNGTHSMSYRIVIDNKSPYTVYSHNTFSTIKISPYIQHNITIRYYENFTSKEFGDYQYTIKNGFFYPQIYVPPNTSILFSYTITGVS